MFPAKKRCADGKRRCAAAALGDNLPRDEQADPETRGRGLGTLAPPAFWFAFPEPAGGMGVPVSSRGGPPGWRHCLVCSFVWVWFCAGEEPTANGIERCRRSGIKPGMGCR